MAVHVWMAPRLARAFLIARRSLAVMCPACERGGLVVVSKKVVLVEPGDWGLAGECGVRPMDVVGVRPPRQRVCSFR